MKYYRLITYVGLLFLGSNSLQAQDPHFSQFYASPLLLNPALTGSGDGLYRVSTIYRDQWRSAVENPIRTYALSGDVSFDMGRNTSGHSDKVAVGLTFFGDRVNTFDFNTTAITLSGSYHKALSKVNNSFLSAGLYIGVGQRNINYEDLTFEDEFNAIDGYTLPSGEFLPSNNFGYADLGLGVNYSMSPSKTTHIYAGIGIFHINSPNISFYKSDNGNNPDLIRSNDLDPKMSIYAGASVATTERWSIQPRILALLQDQQKEFNLGNNFRYQLDYDGSNFLHIGPYLRLSEMVDGIGIESVALAVGFQKGKMLLGLSYDHHLSDLTGDRIGLGAFEFSLSYSGDFDNNDEYCPKF